MTESKAAFRIAMRVEGSWWVAYCARINTMEHAIEMGRIRMPIARASNERKQTFIELMKSALGDFLEEQGIGIASWQQNEAPESERSGNA